MAGTPWTFGVEPLGQTVQVAGLLRRIADLSLRLEQDDPAVDRLVADLEAAEAALGPRVQPDTAPRLGNAPPADGRVYVDHARDIGRFNPAFPEYEIISDGDTASGTVTFPLVYEGPPRIVHGGFLGVFFDCVMQHHNCDAGAAGKTTSLVLRYRRPTPLLTPLRFTLTRSVDDDDRRITSTGQLHLPPIVDDGGTLVCEAEMRAVIGDRDALPAVSPRRTGAPS